VIREEALEIRTPGRQKRHRRVIDAVWFGYARNAARPIYSGQPDDLVAWA